MVGPSNKIKFETTLKSLRTPATSNLQIVNATLCSLKCCLVVVLTIPSRLAFMLKGPPL